MLLLNHRVAIAVHNHDFETEGRVEGTEMHCPTMPRFGFLPFDGTGLDPFDPRELFESSGDER
jgi:hypothetical protein